MHKCTPRNNLPTGWGVKLMPRAWGQEGGGPSPQKGRPGGDSMVCRHLERCALLSLRLGTFQGWKSHFKVFSTGCLPKSHSVTREQIPHSSQIDVLDSSITHVRLGSPASPFTDTCTRGQCALQSVCCLVHTLPACPAPHSVHPMPGPSASLPAPFQSCPDSGSSDSCLAPFRPQVLLPIDTFNS